MMKPQEFELLVLGTAVCVLCCIPFHALLAQVITAREYVVGELHYMYQQSPSPSGQFCAGLCGLIGVSSVL
jgi:hypothetical protein